MWYTLLMAPPIGFRHSQESRNKIRANNSKYWLGKKREDMVGNRFGEALRGRARPPEVIKNIIAGIPKGDRHWNWKGGTTSIRERIWHTPKYREWRTQIFERDDYTCVLCRERSGVLNADHYPKTLRQIVVENKITTTADARECVELWDISNGRTLCLTCHRKTPTWGFPRP